jgi:hypothetical protein
VGFEIFLECQRFVFVRECTVPDQFPRPEFGGVRGFAGIMFWNSPLQVSGCANVFLLRKIDAA